MRITFGMLYVGIASSFKSGMLQIVKSFNSYRAELISALNLYPVCRCPHNSRKTPIARPLGRGMGVFREDPSRDSVRIM